MSQPASISTVPLLTGSEADQRLDRIAGIRSSRDRVFVPTLNAARNGFGVPGRLAPPAACGMRAFLDGTEELRLRLEPHGWRLPSSADLDAAGLVVSPDGATTIAMVSGDSNAGRASYSPQVRYPRGRVASEFIQGILFQEYIDVSPTAELWFLLHRIMRDGWRAELALPSGIGRGGWVSGWRERVQIVEDSGGGHGDTKDTAQDLPAPTVRWRESA